METTLYADRDILQSLAPAIATELGYTVVKREEEITHWVELVSPEGYTIGLSVAYRGGKRDQLHVCGILNGRVNGIEVWSPAKYRNEFNPDANVSIKKSAKQIAADIRRRILPGYLPLLAACEAAKAEYLRNAGSALAIAKKLAALTGGKVHARDPAEPHVSLYGSKLGDGTATVSVRADRVRFDGLDVDPDTATAILELLVNRLRVKTGPA